MILLRAIFLEVLGPFGLTLLVMVGLLMTEKVYRLVNLVVDRRLSLSEVGMMLVYLLPQVLDITLPLAVVGAVFVTVIRQSMDSEVISLRASGRSLWSYALPFLLFGLITTALSSFVTLWLQPTANRKYAELQVEMVRWRAEEKLVPGELNYDFGDKVIRIGGRKSERELADIFIANRELSPTSSVITARSGWIEMDETDKHVVFRLRSGTLYTLQTGNPGFRTVDFDTLRYALEYEPAQAGESPHIRARPTGHLLSVIRAPGTSYAARAEAELEFARRLSMPWACLAFALASIPMAIVDPRSGKRSGYLRAIFLVVSYFIVWGAFKDTIWAGKASPYTLLLPAVLIFLYGTLRLWQLNSDVDSLWRVFRR